MYPTSDSITFIAGPFGAFIPCFKPHYSHVYLLHFDKPFKHARHYLGVAHDLDARLERHRAGNGAKLMEAVGKAGIGFEVVRLWRFESWTEAYYWEKRLKSWQMGPRLCPLCSSLPIDALASLYQGHWPLHLFAQTGRRRPMGQ